MKKNLYLEKLYNSNKPLIIYKVEGGYDLFTDFSEKIKLNNKNLNNFFKKIENINKSRVPALKSPCSLTWSGWLALLGWLSGLPGLTARTCRELVTATVKLQKLCCYA